MTDPMSDREFVRTRRVLRTAGPLLVGAGGLCLVVAMVNFFASMGSFSGLPKLFWLAFIGMPMLAVGLVMTKAGYAGKIARYVGREVGPAASATFNEVADASRPGVRAVSAALHEGAAEAARAESRRASRAPSQEEVLCVGCGVANGAGARFCDQCGEALGQACGSCGERADVDANFCDACGTPIE